MESYIIILLTIFIFINPLRSQTLSQTIIFEERVYDFGTVFEKNGKVSHIFTFHNNGKTPAVIDEIYSDCGCIGKVLSKAPIMPAGKGEVTITFNPAYKSGFFSKEVFVYSNNRQNYNHVWVQGVIIPNEHPITDDYPYNFGNGLYLRLKVMAFGYLKAGETKQMELHYANDTNKEMTLNFVVEGNKGGLKFANPGQIGPKVRGVVTFTYTMPYYSSNDAVFCLYPYVNSKKLTETLQIEILNENKRNQKEQPKQNFSK
ncbi:MAG: DUF1573 domain-containing protein [Bacteroidia bacterium]|nr:DUF1573 domain-containing protein [Bacteroidia bacterium]